MTLGRRSLSKTVLATYLATALTAFPACAPNRAQWMQQAAKEQATTATSPIGNEQQVRQQAAVASVLLDRLTATVQANPKLAQNQVAAQFATDSMQISSGLRAIAESHTDSQFTSAVFAMCAPTRREAAPRVGAVMLGIANGILSHPPANSTELQRQQVAGYYSTFGHRLMNIPEQCDQAAGAMAEASAQEQQAEVQHAKKVNDAETAAAILFAGTVLFASAVGSAAATRPPVTYQTNNYYAY